MAFRVVDSPDGQWWRVFLLVALTGLLLIGVLAVLPVGWVGGALGVGLLTALAVARRRGGATRL
ncbi:MAG TPA: hypothetical protein VK887_16300 [Pseudonocardiaceae bacterium]|nr:hypothetical protein [Pseudonocardiaceae bacterium]